MAIYSLTDSLGTSSLEREKISLVSFTVPYEVVRLLADMVILIHSKKRSKMYSVHSMVGVSRLDQNEYIDIEFE